MISARPGAPLVRSVFGVNLEQQGRGFYVPLELLAITRGVWEADRSQVLDSAAKVVTYRRASHDFARRVAVGTEVPPEVLEPAVQGTPTLQTVRALLSSLIVEIPGRRQAPKWFAAHLYPFVGELIHYDAVERRGRPAIERYTFRDGGGWAYNVLRSDPLTERRLRTRDELCRLVGDSGRPLGRVAAALKTHDTAPAQEFPDSSLQETRVFDDVSPWPEHLRRGVNYIVTRNAVPAAKQIESLMHWVPYCLARHQLHLARAVLDLPRERVLVDATRDTNPLRTRSQELLDEYHKDIANALVQEAAISRRDALAAGDIEGAERLARFAQPGANFTRSPRAFFSGTLAAVGALNSTMGKRHFAFKPPMLEALVAATLEPGHEREYFDFCALAFQEYGLVIDRRTAETIGLTDDIDAGVFTVNEEAFRARLEATGLLTHYSDATSMIHGEPR